MTSGAALVRQQSAAVGSRHTVPGRDPGDHAAIDEADRTGHAQSPRHPKPPQDNAGALKENACVLIGRTT